MSVLEKFNTVAEKSLLPVACKLNRQRHLNALKNGMMASIPLSILGGACLIISTPPFRPEQFTSSNVFTRLMTAWFNWAQTYSTQLRLPFQMSMGLMGLFIAFAIAYYLAKEYKISELNAAIVSTVVFLIVSAPSLSVIPAEALQGGLGVDELGAQAFLAMPTNFLDARGIFTAIIVSIGCVEIMNFMFKKNLRFKMPQGVPPAIVSSFDAIFPIVICTLVFYGLSLFVQSLSGGDLIPAVIMNLLAPAMNGLDSLPGIILITVIAQIFWFFGLHGASITQFVRLPFMSTYLAANAFAFANGEAPLHFFTQPFWSYIIAIGGAGSTLSLSILLLKSKSVQLRELGKISIIPSIFNINEPLIFGMPLVLNPIMMIPFIFVPVVNTIIAYTLMAMNVISRGVAETPWTTPAPLGAILGFMDFRAGILVILLIVLDMVIYYPFLKLMEKQKLTEENNHNNAA